MNKKTLITIGVTAVVVIMLSDKISGLPGVSKLPRF